MTIEEMDAELARLNANLRRWCGEAIEECLADLVVERNRYRREFVEKQLKEYREIQGRFATAA